MIDGLRLALTTFTVAPIRSGTVSRQSSAAAMMFAPLLGLMIGFLLAGLAVGMTSLAAPPLLTGVVVVAAGALVTRGLHLDGLADVMDALGSYAGRERALAIMKQPDIGPFGVVWLVLTLLAQVAAVAAVAPRGLAGILGLVVPAATGRLAITLACRRGIPAARPDGLGALAAGSVPWSVPAIWAAGLMLAGMAAVPGQLWQGPVAVLAGLGAATLLTRHAVRRFGGVTGDVLGAGLELAVTVTLMIVALG